MRRFIAGTVRRAVCCNHRYVAAASVIEIIMLLLVLCPVEENTALYFYDKVIVCLVYIAMMTLNDDCRIKCTISCDWVYVALMTLI